MIFFVHKLGLWDDDFVIENLPKLKWLKSEVVFFCLHHIGNEESFGFFGYETFHLISYATHR